MDSLPGNIFLPRTRAYLPSFAAPWGMPEGWWMPLCYTRTMPPSCLHILGADFPSLVNYVLAQKRLRCGVINRESCFLRTSGPPTDCQVSESEMHFLDFIHSLWKAQKWAFNVKNIIKDICNTATLPLTSKRNKWFFCSVSVSPGSWATTWEKQVKDTKGGRSSPN